MELVIEAVANGNTQKGRKKEGAAKGVKFMWR
jgi:hypothetical protein